MALRPPPVRAAALAAADRASSPAARPWASLKMRLALLGALLIALSVTLTVGLTLHTVDQRSQQDSLDLSLAQTRKAARMVSMRLVQLQLALRAAAGRIDHAAPGDVDAARRFLAERDVLAQEMHTILVADPRGRVLALRDRDGVHLSDLDIGDRSYFRLTLAQQRPIISEAQAGDGEREAGVMLTFPVRGNDGRIAAVIGGSISLAGNVITRELTADDEDDPAQTVIVDPQGRVIAHPRREWLMRDAALEPSLAQAVAHWVAQGRPVEPSGHAGRYGEYIVSHAGVPDAEWVVFRTVAHDRVLAGLADARRQAVMVGAGVALAGGIALLVTTFVMLRPLRRLEACAGVLARGDTPKDDEWPKVAGELGQLTDVLRDALQQRALADAKGRELLQRLQAVMAHAPVGFAFTRDKHFEAVSVQFERLLGYPPGALDFTPARQIYASDAVYDALGARVAAAFTAQRPLDEELEFIRRDGSVFWGRLRGQPVQWGHPSGGTIWTLEDVSEQRRERQSLAWTSTHDALTGLVNRAEFEHRLTDRLAERRDGEAALLFLDLDRFKAVNDSAGHAAGDAVLVETGRALERLVRHGDTVARIGGDEFAVLLPDCSLANALRIAEKMRSAVDALEVPFGSGVLRVGASIGVAAVQSGQDDTASLLAAADAACYVVKRGGRNGVHLHGRADTEAAEADALA